MIFSLSIEYGKNYFYFQKLNILKTTNKKNNQECINFSFYWSINDTGAVKKTLAELCKATGAVLQEEMVKIPITSKSEVRTMQIYC